MTWAEFSAARQVLAEERVGASVRETQRVEDATILGLRTALRRQG